MSNQTVLKTFICSSFTNSSCTYTNTGVEDLVIGEADDHLVEEHGFVDSPQLRKDIQNSLVTTNSDNS